MSDKPRILQTFQPLPQRESAQERIAQMGTDVREAMALADKRLRDQAATLSAQGWTVDEAYANDTDNRFQIVGRTVIARLRITR